MMYTKVLEFANVFTNKQRNESHVRAYPCVIVGVYMFCLSNLNALQSAQLKEILTKPHNSPDELDKACALIEVSGARTHSHNLARSLAQQADACIDENLFSKDTVAILHAMTAFFIQRNA